MNIIKLTRSHALAALQAADAPRTLIEEAFDHPNQHVRRSAWRLLGMPIPEDAEGRKSLAAKLYPNHLQRLQANPAAKAPANLRKILEG